LRGTSRAKKNRLGEKTLLYTEVGQGRNEEEPKNKKERHDHPDKSNVADQAFCRDGPDIIEKGGPSADQGKKQKNV